MIKSKVLITGITGMVGSHLADLLLKNTNWEIYGMLDGVALYTTYRICFISLIQEGV